MTVIQLIFVADDTSILFTEGTIILQRATILRSINLTVQFQNLSKYLRLTNDSDAQHYNTGFLLLVDQ